MKSPFGYLGFLFVIVCVCSLRFNLKAQTAAYDSIITSSIEFYMNIDKTSMQSNYLFNKGFIVLEDCEKWRNGLPIISKPWKWRFIYEAVERSCVNSQCTTFPKFDSLLNSNSINRFGDSDIQLACLNFEGEYFSQAAIESYVANNSAVLFESFKLFSGSVLYGKSFSGNVNFKWDSKHYFSNKNGNELLSVNLSDGSGWISLPIDGSISINSYYDCIGEKRIAFRSIEGQDTIYSYSSINIKIVNPLSPTEVNTISIIIEDSTDYSQSRMSTPGNGTIEVHGEYFYFQGIDGKLDKPIIISEGFDIAGDQDWTDLVDENHLTHLLHNGYDVFYLTYTRSNRSLLDNAVIVKELIKKINNEKVLHFEGIYIGESMGGILGRIALKQLENEGYNHQFGLFIALDAPMKGANVPLGLQWIANDLISSLGLFAVFTTIGAELFELFTNTDQPYVDILGQLTSPAARQMIIKHYLGNADYQFMQNYLDQLSYPEKCRNVCATSGGENIIENVISSAFSEEYIISPLAVVVPIGPYSATISARY